MTTIPRTTKEAKNFGYKPTKSVDLNALSKTEKKKWALIKPGAATSPHIVCYYNPATGAWDDCREEG